AVVATVVALLASAVGLFSRRPALVHSLWLLVLIKLITPPICRVEVFQLPTSPKAEAVLDTKHFASELRLDTSDLSTFLTDCQPNEDFKVDDAPVLVRDETAFSPGSSLALSDSTTSENALSWSFVRPLLWSVWLTGSLGCLLVAAIRVIRFQ